MRKCEWIVAGVIAVVVGALTMTLTAPPVCWADEQPVAVPALPSTTLLIAAVSARVEAAAVPEPGTGVKVKLTAQAPPSQNLKEVPVIVSVSRTVSNPMARVMPRPEPIAHVKTFVPLDANGNGWAMVPLPLTWAHPEAPVQATQQPTDENAKLALLMRAVTTYQMRLSSPLGGEAAPSALPPEGNAVRMLDLTPAPPPNLPVTAPLTTSADPFATPRLAAIELGDLTALWIEKVLGDRG